MFGQIYRNGYIRHLLDIMTSPKPVLPGSQAPLLTRYLDGSDPALSLYAFQFGGQLVPIFLAIMIEGSRMGNSKNLLSFTVMWGYAMQTCGYAITMPIYGAVQLFISPTFVSSGKALATAVVPQNASHFDLGVLVPAFFVGYFLPTLLMSLPLSPAVHQWLGATWQGFPLYVVACQHLFARLVNVAPQSNAEVLSRAYNWAFNIAAVTQLCTYALILAVKTAPGLFPSWAQAAFSFSSVFRPGRFYSTEPLPSLATAMHDFFKWDQYVGSVAAITWGIALYLTSRKSNLSWRAWATLSWNILWWSVLAGPAGALMRLLQRRDEAIVSTREKNDVKDP
ncbi:hypothetical protein MFIFM68171_05514 [Madurella fahalii]|uniref:Uncharacterized protein n=1 Tax=Madurella fahalii TaxID=1157608 RepID=A0ABQ0GC51_9PEZI